MWFIDNIVTYCKSISDFFYQIYLEVLGWVYPFWYAATFFYSLSSTFASLAWGFYYFGQWVDDVATKVASILTYANISSYFAYYFNSAVNAWNWISNAWFNVINIIDNWWNIKSTEIFTWINDIYSWTTVQLNSITDWVLILISDVEAWTLTQVDSAKTATLAIISDLETWTQTEFNIVRDWVLVVWSDIETWTLTQVATARTAILAIITDIETWTTTQINNIQAAITAFLPWDTILANIISWGGLPALIIQGLIDSTLKAWFPFYDDLVNLWNSIVEFFTDPWGWLYDRFDDFIERFW